MRGGSRPGKEKNRDKSIAQGAEQIDRDYFNRVCMLPTPIAKAEFERRFRISPTLRQNIARSLWVGYTQT
jgi:hypothetical protein